MITSWPTDIDYAFVGTGEVVGEESEEALAEELVVFGVLFEQVDAALGDAVLDFGLRVIGTPPHDAGPKVHAHLRDGLFQVCKEGREGTGHN